MMFGAMQLWFARSSAVPLREQLVTQITLAILADDLAPGQRLPSTRELARRFRLHPNTISAGYRQLARNRWVELRRGSGVYVRARGPETAVDSELALDQKIAHLFRFARTTGVSLAELRIRLRHWLEMQPPDHFLLIEPDEELRRILLAEIRAAVNLPVKPCSTEDVPESISSAIAIMLPNREAAARKMLPGGSEAIVLQVRSVPSSLAAYLPAPPGALVAIASRWPEFLKLARAVLSAAGFHPDSLVFRDARRPGWQQGLEQTVAVVCDTLTAADLPRRCRAIPFPLLSEASRQELQRYEAFLRNPFDSM